MFTAQLSWERIQRLWQCLALLLLLQKQSCLTRPPGSCFIDSSWQVGSVRGRALRSAGLPKFIQLGLVGQPLLHAQGAVWLRAMDTSLGLDLPLSREEVQVLVAAVCLLPLQIKWMFDPNTTVSYAGESHSCLNLPSGKQHLCISSSILGGEHRLSSALLSK